MAALLLKVVDSCVHAQTLTNIPAVVYDACGIVVGEKAVGSGFWASEKEFITCLHVVAGAGERLVVRTRDGKTFRSSGVKFFSAEDDLAVLQLDQPQNAHLRLSEETSIGVKIASIGNSEGVEVLKTDSGVIEADGPRFLEVSAQIRPGCSGGPIVTQSGEVVAMSSFLTFKTIGIVGGRTIRSQSLDRARKFGVKSVLIKQGLQSAQKTEPKPLAAAQAAFYEYLLTPVLVEIRKVVAQPFGDCLAVRLNYEHRQRRSPVTTTTSTEPVYGNYVPMGRTRTTTSGGDVTEDRIVLIGGDTDTLRDTAALCETVESVLGKLALEENAAPQTSAAFKYLRVLLEAMN